MLCLYLIKIRTELPNVMYSQVLKYELNDTYHFIKAMHS